MTTTTIHTHRNSYTGRDPKRRLIGWLVVIAVHIVVLWALITGTARKGLEIIKKPLEAAVIQEVIIPPPPPPPPKPVEQPKQIQKVEAPPPPFIPPPEVAAPSTAPTISSVATPPPVMAPIAPPAPAAPPAPSGRQDMTVACPTQVKPEMPRQAIREGAEGTVKAQALIRSGKVVDVTILSGPRVFHQAVRSAMMQYGCISGSGDIIATQEFNFKIE